MSGRPVQDSGAIDTKADKITHRDTRIVRTATTAASGRIGFMAGEIKVPDDFDTMDGEEIVDQFEGSDR